MEQALESWLLYTNRRPKILIADDQAINIRVLHELFADQCQIYMATSGTDAISICQREVPDLVLLDVVMEDINGHEVCRALKSDSLTCAIPVIFVTSQNLEIDEVSAFAAGAVDFITKPINPAIVRARVNTHLTLKLQGDLLRSNALLDGLTGIGNRRKFDEELQRNWRQASRDQTPLSLIMLDVDFFKRYNDRYGHQVGDACLKLIAKALFATARRPYDSVARYGGEEFACLLPNTDLRGAVSLAEKIMVQVANLQLEHLESEVGQFVTVSLGVASSLPRATLDVHDLVASADMHLYRAKNTGRRRISSELTLQGSPAV